jgi:hypothetical protein
MTPRYILPNVNCSLVVQNGPGQELLSSLGTIHNLSVDISECNVRSVLTTTILASRDILVVSTARDKATQMRAKYEAINHQSTVSYVRLRLNLFLICDVITIIYSAFGTCLVELIHVRETVMAADNYAV